MLLFRNSLFYIFRNTAIGSVIYLLRQLVIESVTWVVGRSVDPSVRPSVNHSFNQRFGVELARQVTSQVRQLDTCGYLPLFIYHVVHPEATMHTDIPQALSMQRGLRPKRRSKAVVKKLMMRRMRPTSTVAMLGSMPLPTSCKQRVYVQQSQENNLRDLSAFR
jgi:hypothetical protein